nr:MAG TPA: hypothetical protein [Caudoviricetes sp.]
MCYGPLYGAIMMANHLILWEKIDGKSEEGSQGR